MTAAPIARVEPIMVALPARRPHPMAFGGEALGRYVIVRVHCEDGTVGLGEATVLPQWGGDHGRYFGELPATTVTLLGDVLGPAIAGMDAGAIELVHERMDRTLRGYPYAKAAIDMALHDIRGKRAGVPVFELLGGAARREVTIAHSLGILDIDVLVAEAAAAVAEGVRTIKVKVGLDAERDVAAVREVRSAVGDGVRICIDGNQGYATPKQAIALLRAIERYGIHFAEQPVEGLDAMAAVTAAVPMPVAADESAWSPRDVLEIAQRQAADVISLYTTKPGGLLRAREAAAVAAAAGLPCNVNGSAETGVGNAANLHLAASAAIIREACVIPVTTLAGREQTRVAGVLYTDDIVTEPFPYADGALSVPTGPGLGVELDDEKVERYRVA